MKKISSTFASNHEYIARPFALVNHTHPEYLRSDLTETSSNGSVDFQMTAGAVLSALKVVRPTSIGKLIYASSADDLQWNDVIGITTTAGGVGDIINVRRLGLLTDPSWTWTTNLPVFLGVNGVLTQTAPTSGFICIVGKPFAADTLFINVDRTITL